MTDASRLATHPQKMPRRGLMLVLSSPSGAGKSSIARRLLGARLDPRDRLLTTKSAAQAATWIATAQYLSLIHI